MAEPLRLLLAGFGNVGQRFVELLADRPAHPGLAGLDVVIVGLTTGSHGAWSGPSGLAPAAILEQYRTHGGFPGTLDTLEAIRTLEYDVLLELSPLSIKARGEPAITHVRTALGRGRHVVSANKGPVAWAWRELDGLARARGARFLHEATVMDGAPVFNLGRHCLRGNTLLRLDGVLNSTTNVVLGAMEQGLDLAEAVAQAQAMGIAEADPRADLEGWDAAVKLTALANVLMAADLTPEAIERQGIERLTRQEVAGALGRGQRIKLVCEAFRDGGTVRGSVTVRHLDQDHPFARIAGASSILRLHTDLLGRLIIAEDGPDLSTTAYGLITDLFALLGA
jgi:homoserine dehydrogenase